jgi:hypothetical protein
MAGHTNLALDVAALIVAVGGSTQRRAGLVSSGDATTLCEVLLSLCSADLDLLLLAAATELVGLEGALGLEGGAAMFGDVLVSHGCGDSGGRGGSGRVGEEVQQCLFARRGFIFLARGVVQGGEKAEAAKRTALAVNGLLLLGSSERPHAST